MIEFLKWFAILFGTVGGVFGSVLGLAWACVIIEEKWGFVPAFGLIIFVVCIPFAALMAALH